MEGVVFMASQYVKASMLGQLLKSLPSFLDKTLTWLDDTDLQVKDQEEIKDEKTGQTVGYMYTAKTGGNHKFRVKVMYSSGRDDICDVYLLGNEGQKGKKAHLREKEVEDFITDWVESTYNESFETIEDGGEDFEVNEDFDNRVDEDIEESTKLYAKLTKVQGNEEVILNGIFANYDPIEAYADLEDVLDSDEFLDSLEDGDNLFVITPEDDFYDIDTCDTIPETPIVNHLCAILQSALSLRTQFIYLILQANKQADLMTKDRIRSILYVVEDEINFIINYREFVENQTVSCEDMLNASSITCNESLDRCIADHITILEYSYPNLPHNLQQLIDSWINTLQTV